MSNREMRVLIVGAGIAGLTLHALLQRRDIESCGIDKAALSGHAGYLLGLWPLGSHVLHGLHLFGRYVEASAPKSHYRILNEHGGTLRELSFDSISDQYGCLGMISRGGLLDLLSENVSLHNMRRVHAIQNQSRRLSQFRLREISNSVRCTQSSA